MEIPAKISIELALIYCLTSKNDPWVPSGKIVVVIPDPPGHVNDIPTSLILLPVVTPWPTAVIVAIPVDAV